MWALLAGRSTTVGPWLAGLVGVRASSLVACISAVVGEASFSPPGSEAGLELACSFLAPGFAWLPPGFVELVLLVPVFFLYYWLRGPLTGCCLCPVFSISCRRLPVFRGGSRFSGSTASHLLVTSLHWFCACLGTSYGFGWCWFILLSVCGLLCVVRVLFLFLRGLCPLSFGRRGWWRTPP